MKPRGRLVVFLAGGLVAAAMVVAGLLDMPPFGHYRGPYGNVINRVAVPERHATNAVVAVVIDYRGFDTLGEELILFTAVMGVTLLLRIQRGEREPPAAVRAEDHVPQLTSDAVRVGALCMIAPLVVMALYLVTHGQASPGGGFQGGAVLAAAPLMVYLAGRYVTFRALDPPKMLDLGEGLGAAGFLVMGLVGMVAGMAYLANVLPLGRTGSVLSAGTLPVINLAIGLEVGAGIVFVIYEFMEQTLLIRRR
jgi:multicomponent Na+:H+ antiporter subunit B